ncbi:MAG TPA: polyprenyl synthetase family protein, partial [Polyangiaceae bacterium]|nr:polyprenyl synthetase family protein [Polyangiaceae bacterium]
MKTQKLEDLSDMPAEAAADILGRAAEAQGADARVTQRIATVQDILADDLSWIESALSGAVDEGEVPATLAARHLVTRGGKRVRPIALLLSAACFGRISPAARELAVVAELVHSATLLHDDVVDEGMERRGVATSRLSWGNAISVLGGDLLLVHALS